MGSDYELVRSALEFIESEARQQPELAEVAAHVGLSPHHFQRLFRRWVGISPKRFLQHLTLDAAKAVLARSDSVLDASYAAGLSSPGRLHDLFVNLEAVTPGEFKAGGRDLIIRTGIHESPFGSCLLALTERGLCGLSFDDAPDCRQGLADLRAAWPAARIVEDAAATRPVFEQLFDNPAAPDRPRIDLYVRGSNFQLQVWRALLAIPPGQLDSYGEIARRIGRPGAARAVGCAVGSNPVAWLIPCHRVITSMGSFGHYRWGALRKRAMIGWELSRAEAEAEAEAESAAD
jgi:AraC family transcriptional regulator of adaptative response/methylated-DNA-[protein]-cysteine methyltransferase